MRSVTAVVLMAMLVLTGCGSKKEEPPPWSPTPRPSVATPAATQSSPSQEELFAEAERVFRRSLEITARYESNGDFSGFPAEMSEVAMGEYLASSKVLYDFMAEKRWKTAPGTSPTITSEPAPGYRLEGSVATLHVCTDSRQSPLVDESGIQVNKGALWESRFFFNYDTDGLLKIAIEQYREVETCELAG